MDTVERLLNNIAILGGAFGGTEEEKEAALTKVYSVEVAADLEECRQVMLHDYLDQRDFKEAKLQHWLYLQVREGLPWEEHFLLLQGLIPLPDGSRLRGRPPMRRYTFRGR